MATSDAFLVTNTTKGKPPRLPFLLMKDSILGKRYSISLVFIGDKRARSLNRKYRKKDYIPNVLTFPLTEAEGEIFINLLQVRRDMKKFNLNYQGMVGLLFIHALLHLKGTAHGSTMERIERTWMKKFRL